MITFIALAAPVMNLTSSVLVRFSLCNLCVLCVSAVNKPRNQDNHRDTENTEDAQRLFKTRALPADEPCCIGQDCINRRYLSNDQPRIVFIEVGLPGRRHGKLLRIRVGISAHAMEGQG